MEPIDPGTDLLSFHAMPEVAAALRQRHEQIIQQWDHAVEQLIPDAQPLTIKQVRDSIPAVLDKIAQALESSDPEATAILGEVGTAHGVARFQENYRIDELLTEYRLLRRIVLGQIDDVTGGSLTLAQSIAVNIGIDIAMNRGVLSFVEHLRERLQSSAAAESKFLSFLSHDLRNGLNGITLTLELLSRRLAGAKGFEQEAQDLASAQGAIHQTIDGMDRLLQAERLRKQAVELKLAPVVLHNLVAELIQQATSQAVNKGLSLENHVPPQAKAFSDRELVALVLQNLLNNATKYSQRGTIRVEATIDESGWRIGVRDEGPGIAPDKVKSLFDAFTRGETHGQPGMGLGLHIASHAARLLGSELSVHSVLGQGSTFSFAVTQADATAE